MDIIEFAEKIGLPASTRDAALAYTVEPEEEKRLRGLFDSEFKEFSLAIGEKDDPNLCVLALYLKWSAEAVDTWRENGIPDSITFDTFRDITIWSDRCIRVTGRIGLIEWIWFIVHIGMRLFRLGRLQFEPGGTTRDITLPDGTLIPNGTPLLGVHIPRGESLTKENIKESFDMSKEFFPKYLGKSYDTYICNSWLLAEGIEELVSPDSGILELGRYFTIFENHTGYCQAEDYVFDGRMEDKSLYPEDTGVRRRLKKMLMEGRTIGMGEGIAKY